jgi:hypothetical protein
MPSLAEIRAQQLKAKREGKKPQQSNAPNLDQTTIQPLFSTGQQSSSLRNTMIPEDGEGIHPAFGYSLSNPNKAVSRSGSTKSFKEFMEDRMRKKELNPSPPASVSYSGVSAVTAISIHEELVQNREAIVTLAKTVKDLAVEIAKLRKTDPGQMKSSCK